MSDPLPTKNNSTSPPPLRHATLSDLSYGLNTNLFTSESLTKAYISCIHEVNPEFHAVIQLNPHATHDASLLNTNYTLCGPRTPLHRIPILLKDNIPTLDDTDTTCGSMALVGARPSKEADVVTALRKAGAVILGKGNMAEWSGFRSTNGCSGWSARGGQTRGVYLRGMKPSGSSSGCAVGVALGLCAAAIGTETCYSVVSPAEKSGIVGFKPTRNVISSEGLIHASKTLDTVGLLTRSVDDARSILREITQHSAHHTTESKAKFLNQLSPKPFPNLKTIRIGIPSLTLFTNFHPAKTTAFTNALSALEEAGATIAKNVHIPGHETYTSLSPAQKSIILDTDMKLAIECYLSSLTTNPQNIHTLQDLITFTQNCAEEEYPPRNTAVLERALLTSPSNSLYLDMLALDEYFSTGLGSIANALDNHACDVLIIPTLDPTLQTLAAKAGSPVVSVPIGVFGAGTNVQVDPGNGMVDVGPGIPFSAYIFGRVDCDGDVLGVAQVLEREMKVRDMLEPYLEAVTEVGDV